jgi:hypothetical protein
LWFYVEGLLCQFGCFLLFFVVVSFLVGKRVTMSLEIFFQCESSAFLFVSWGLFVVLYGVSGSVFAGLACACMLVSVKFHVGMRGVWMLVSVKFGMLRRALREEKFQKKKTTIPLYLLLPLLIC